MIAFRKASATKGKGGPFLDHLLGSGVDGTPITYENMTKINVSMYAWLFSLCAIWPIWLSGQDLGGSWIGKLTEYGTEVQFDLTLEWEATGSILEGQMQSVGSDTSLRAIFQVSGWQRGEDSIYIQDIQQLQPAKPLWCTKRMRLWSKPGRDTLRGRWDAPGCRGGEVVFYRPVVTRVQEIEVPFQPAGAWTGQLNQSDRAYGFYYTLDLQPDGTGFSYIVSEGSGGEARHALRWSFDVDEQVLRFYEHEVVERTIPDWKWCLKQGQVRWDKVGQSYVLSGQWSGKIEGATGPNSVCAPGRLRLEKPVLTQVVTEKKRHIEQLPVLRKRPIRVSKTMDVEREKIRLFLWDNGMVDGDVISVYLNGQRLLDKYRVRKSKAELTINLQKGANFLVLVSDDMGSVPPTTIAISIHDGHAEHPIVLRSNQYESGAVLVRRIDF